MYMYVCTSSMGDVDTTVLSVLHGCSRLPQLVQESDSWTLLITKTKSDMSGRYQVTAANKRGTAHSACDVTVSALGKILRLKYVCDVIVSALGDSVCDVDSTCFCCQLRRRSALNSPTSPSNWVKTQHSALASPEHRHLTSPGA